MPATYYTYNLDKQLTTVTRPGGQTVTLTKQPPTKAGGFVLRLKAGLIGRTADCPLSQDWEG